MPEELLDIYAKFNALPYHGEADDIGHAVVFIASDEYNCMTGNTLKIEGCYITLLTQQLQIQMLGLLPNKIELN